MLEQAVAMSLATDNAAPASTAPSVPDFASMTEEEQIAYAMQMSLQQTRNILISVELLFSIYVYERELRIDFCVCL